MEKKHSKKKSKSACKKDCKGRILSDGSYCHCIEDKLPKLTRQSVGVLSTDKIEIYGYDPQAESPSESEQRLSAKLRAYGLDEHEVELVLQRYYDDYSLREIVEESGWTSTGSANYAHKLILDKLRKRGFKA